jgi:hypothetical protein
MIPRRHLMDPWRDSLIMELRMRDVSGERIGEVLAEVDAYCADSGQTPDEAFGDPVTYARELIDIHAPARPGLGQTLLRPAAMTFATVAGILGLLDGVDAIAHGRPGEVTAGQVTGVALGTALFPLVAYLLFHPSVFRRPGLRAGVLMVGPGVTGAPLVLWTTPVAHASGWVLLTAGLFLLAVAWWPSASNRLLRDRIIDPRTGSEPFPPPRLALAVVRWFLPVVLLVTVAVTVLVP